MICVLGYTAVKWITARPAIDVIMSNTCGTYRIANSTLSDFALLLLGNERHSSFQSPVSLWVA
ncbi:hypothetical protein DPMN_006806 [Dreissena polymorpha]|uniref:Uncharacterized protein n=1 Tax=Dreissena polymorpha TaxID=45954 RepID=A0A9D4MT40_DREPO|nr:hypothetical protein DPMN_006806 [Dreissena polymorpha]